jgi:hypothetical protein
MRKPVHVLADEIEHTIGYHEFERYVRWRARKSGNAGAS